MENRQMYKNLRMSVDFETNASSKPIRTFSNGHDKISLEISKTCKVKILWRTCKKLVTGKLLKQISSHNRKISQKQNKNSKKY